MRIQVDPNLCRGKQQLRICGIVDAVSAHSLRGYKIDETNRSSNLFSNIFENVLFPTLFGPSTMTVIRPGSTAACSAVSCGTISASVDVQGSRCLRIVRPGKGSRICRRLQCQFAVERQRKRKTPLTSLQPLPPVAEPFVALLVGYIPFAQPNPPDFNANSIPSIPVSAGVTSTTAAKLEISIFASR